MSLKDYKGVLTGDQVQELFEAAKVHQFALPSVNVIGTNTINAVMETAKAVNSPVIIQFSNGGAQFYAGKSLDNSKLQACILGAVSAAKHVPLLAEHFGVWLINTAKTSISKIKVLFLNELIQFQIGKSTRCTQLQVCFSDSFSDTPVVSNNNIVVTESLSRSATSRIKKRGSSKVRIDNEERLQKLRQREIFGYLNFAIVSSWVITIIYSVISQGRGQFHFSDVIMDCLIASVPILLPVINLINKYLYS